jgi:hypothetical protein
MNGEFMQSPDSGGIGFLANQCLSKAVGGGAMLRFTLISNDRKNRKQDNGPHNQNFLKGVQQDDRDGSHCFAAFDHSW